MKHGLFQAPVLLNHDIQQLETAVGSDATTEVEVAGMSSPMDTAMQKRKKKIKGAQAEVQAPKEDLEVDGCELGTSPVVQQFVRKKK